MTWRLGVVGDGEYCGGACTRCGGGVLVTGPWVTWCLGVVDDGEYCGGACTRCGDGVLVTCPCPCSGILRADSHYTITDCYTCVIYEN